MGKILFIAAREELGRRIAKVIWYFFKPFFRLLFLSLKFFFFIIKIPLANKGIDNKKIIKE